MNAHRLDAMLALAAAGAMISLYLSWTALFGERELACGPIGDCHTVQGSQYASVAGIPVAVLGLALYLSLLGMLGIRRWRLPDSALLGAWTFSIALSGVLYSAYLTYLELFVIHAICAWCVASAVIVGLLFLLSMPDAQRQMQRA